MVGLINLIDVTGNWFLPDIWYSKTLKDGNIVKVLNT